MTNDKMHENELHTDADLVQRLLADQFPGWAGLSIRRVPSAGTDNALYRLGDDLVARLPRIDWAVSNVEKERRWLPKLALQLPFQVPVPVGLGQPGEGYPWPWSVYRWLDGENLAIEDYADAQETAVDLARFIATMQSISTAGGPPAGPPHSGRGVPLATRDQEVQAAIAELGDKIDVDRVTAVWEDALDAPEWERPPVWIHGDLQAGNLLAQNGRLRAVIDFGCLCVGDPASDVMAAWMFLNKETRPVFREALQVDEATWRRAKGWALSVGLIALPYYEVSNPVLAGIARRAIIEVCGG